MQQSEKGESGYPDKKQQRFWPQLKRLLIFQVKLYVDAFRDFFLSLLSLLAFVLDVIQQNHGPGSHFESVLSLGRRSEKAINLFDQHDPDEQDARSVDGVIREVEKRFRE